MYCAKNINKNKLDWNWISYLKNEIKEVSDDEKEIEKPDEVVNLIENICDFNNQIQEIQGLKILTSN